MLKHCVDDSGLVLDVQLLGLPPSNIVIPLTVMKTCATEKLKERRVVAVAPAPITNRLADTTYQCYFAEHSPSPRILEPSLYAINKSITI